MEAQLPRVAECLDLLDLACDGLELAVLDVALAGGNLPFVPELDALGMFQVDHLDLAAEPLAAVEACHHLEAVAQDPAVRPVGLVLVELHEVEALEAIEALEQGELRLRLAAAGGHAEVLDQHPRVDLLLDVDGRCVGFEVGLVERLLALPHEHGTAKVAGMAEERKSTRLN